MTADCGLQARKSIVQQAKTEGEARMQNRAHQGIAQKRRIGAKLAAAVAVMTAPVGTIPHKSGRFRARVVQTRTRTTIRRAVRKDGRTDRRDGTEKMVGTAI